MTSPPSPPNRHRRRVVVTIAVVTMGLCWWFWPSYPRHLVGRWRSRDGVYGVEPDEPKFAVTLNDDGTGLMTSNGFPDTPIDWITEGPVVVIAMGHRPGVLGQIDRQMERFFPKPPSTGLSVTTLEDERWFVERVGEDELRWTALAAGETTPSPESGEVWNLIRAR